MVSLSGDERSQFHAVGQEKEDPVKQDDSIGLSAAPVFIILDCEYHQERCECEDGRPEPEVGRPDTRKRLDLNGGLESSIYYQCTQNNLFMSNIILVGIREGQLSQGDVPVSDRSANSSQPVADVVS